MIVWGAKSGVGVQLPAFPEPQHEMIYCDIHIPQHAQRCAVKAPAGKKLFPSVLMGDALGDLPEVGNHNMREAMEYRWVAAWLAGWMDGYLAGQMDGWIEGVQMIK